MKRSLIISVFILVFFGACSAENASAQSANDAQRIIGTWVFTYNSGETATYIFNNNGTFTGSDIVTGEQYAGRYFVNNNNLVINFTGQNSTISRGYNMSTDGRIIVFNHRNDLRWFIKQ